MLCDPELSVMEPQGRERWSRAAIAGLILITLVWIAVLAKLAMFLLHRM